MNRRNLIKTTALSGLALLTMNRLAQAAEPLCSPSATPVQPEGPFYPIENQLDTDSDLVQLKGSVNVAAGEIIWIKGTVQDQFCIPVSGVLVEIWQACHTGKYNHPSDPNPAALDPNFQYWGKAVTDSNGNYKFRTILPGAYPADTDWIRPAHIHYKVSKKGYLELITQMYFKGDQYNSADKILKRLSPSQRNEVIVELKNLDDDKLRTGHFDIKIEKI